ncbi:zinc ion binding [Abeliophyllum distichum]
MSVLNGGPYFVYGRPLMLKIMPHCFGFDDKEISIMPVWITLPGLLFACWNQTVLGKIVSMVGKPITTDKLTVSKERISHARVLVEVDASIPLTRRVHIMLPTGLRYQPVFYEHEPKICTSCKVFGHATSSCSSKAKVQDNSSNLPPKNNTSAHIIVENADKTGIEETAAPTTAVIPVAAIDEPDQFQELGEEQHFTVVSRTKKRTSKLKQKQSIVTLPSSSAPATKHVSILLAEKGTRSSFNDNTCVEKRLASTSTDKKKGNTLPLSS